MPPILPSPRHQEITHLYATLPHLCDPRVLNACFCVLLLAVIAEQIPAQGRASEKAVLPTRNLIKKYALSERRANETNGRHLGETTITRLPFPASAGPREPITSPRPPVLLQGFTCRALKRKN